MTKNDYGELCKACEAAKRRGALPPPPDEMPIRAVPSGALAKCCDRCGKRLKVKK